MRGRRVLAALAVTALVFGACFVTILGLLVVAERADLLRGGDRVAVVEVEGIILDAEPVVRELQRHAEEPAVRAVVVRVQSPGGVVAPTQEIHGAIRRLRAEGKPVVASLGAVAASGGYYLAVAADRIVANPGTLTGSIGVLIQLAEIEGLLRKVGVRYQVVKAGRYKDLGHIGRPMSEEERAILQRLLDDLYEQFVEAVVEGRHLPRETVLGLADGRAYSGRQAKALGLVDSLGGLEDALQIAADLAGIPGKPVVVRPRRPFRLTDLLEWLGGRGSLLKLAGPAGLGGSPWLVGGAAKLPLYLME